ncbi:MAG: NAD(P)/FAD-dependent oxidoreductase [Bacteroidota bacterium]
MQTQYDVIIPGGGLAGLTLAIQLKRAKPDITILILESRATEAATAAHKVGESTVELATHYMREVLDLKGYLEEHELPKHGLRFFFKTNHKEEISNRVELGPRLKLPVPSHQLDRGTLENYLAKHAQELGAKLILGAKAREVNFSPDGHEVIYIKDEQEVKVTCRWVADATGRGSLLKRKLQFQKPMEHHVNAVWWRVKGVVDIDDWSDNTEWKHHLEPRLRYLSTVHFMDTGYWFWVIPLGSKNTSLGIVADPAVHPFEEINKYDKALKWLEKNEPLCYKMVKPFGEGDGLMDFKVLKHFAHESQRFYSADRWGVTGEAGAFLDPFYSPGSDFISLANTWLSDLILRDLNGEDITVRAHVYEQAHLAHLQNWIPIYQNKYLLMGNTQIMVMKIFWDWAIYWAVPCVLFTNKAFTDLKLLKQLFASTDSLGRKFGQLNKVMQDFFQAWKPYDTEIFSNHYIDPFDVGYMREFQQGIEVQHGEKIVEQIAKSIEKLEKIAAAIFRLVSGQVKGTSPDMRVDPYSISFDADETKHANGLFPDESIAKDVDTIWFYNKKELVQSS